MQTNNKEKMSSSQQLVACYIWIVSNIFGDKAPLKTGVRGNIIGGEGGYGVGVAEGGRAAAEG